MKSWAIWTARTVLVTTGFAAAGGGLAGAALASTPGGTNSGDISVLGDNQVNVPVSVPIDICGNAAAILGFAMAGCQGGASVAGGASSGGSSGAQGPQTGNISVLHGTNVQVPVVIAADACGNSVGNATAKCHGGVHLPASTAMAHGMSSSPGQNAGNVSVGSGNDVQIPVDAPVNACGNAVAVLGDSSAGCAGGASVGNPVQQRAVVGNHGGAVKPPSANQLAGLGALPGVANLPALGGLSGLPLLTGLTGGGPLLPASTLSAYQSEPGGVSDGSFITLAVGALLAGSAALKLAGGRPRPRSAQAKGVAA